MLSFSIPDTKSFMAMLLKGQVFDRFCLHTAQVTSYASFYIEGARQEAYYTAEEKEAGISACCSWAEIKPTVFQLVRGERTPVSMKFTFTLPQEKLEQFPNAASLCLNIVFREGKIHATTAVTQKLFSLDKHLDDAWDAWVDRFFKEQHILVIKEA